MACKAKNLRSAVIVQILTIISLSFVAAGGACSPIRAKPSDRPQAPPGSQAVAKNDLPLEVSVHLIKNDILPGEPILISYRVINHSSTPWLLILPNEGQAWLKFRLLDNQGHQVGAAEASEFAGLSTIYTISSSRCKPLITTRVHLREVRNNATNPLKPGGSDSMVPPPAYRYGLRWGNAFEDQLHLTFSEAKGKPDELTPGTYTLVADVVLPLREDQGAGEDFKRTTPSGRKSVHSPASSQTTVRTPVIRSWPAWQFEELNLHGHVVLDPLTQNRMIVWDPLPAALSPTAHLNQSFTLPLTVRSYTGRERTQFRIDTENLAKRLTSLYEPVSFVTLAQNTPPVPVIQPKLDSPDAKEALSALFGRSDPTARGAQATVAHAVMEASKQHAWLAGEFFQHVANLGTPEAADFLAEQAWEQGRVAALQPLSSMFYYAGINVQKQVKASFEAHHEPVPAQIGRGG